MTVTELIKILEGLNGDAEVLIGIRDANCSGKNCPIVKVHINVSEQQPIIEIDEP